MTLELGPDDIRLKLRSAGSCRLCVRAHGAGAEAIYERARKAIRCVECDKPAVEAPPVEAVGGEARASARRGYERRRDAREQRIRGEHPKLGGLILALSDDPQSTKAWERGAVGEVHVVWPRFLVKRMTEAPVVAFDVDAIGSRPSRSLRDRHLPLVRGARLPGKLPAVVVAQRAELTCHQFVPHGERL